MERGGVAAPYKTAGHEARRNRDDAFAEVGDNTKPENGEEG